MLSSNTTGLNAKSSGSISSSLDQLKNGELESGQLIDAVPDSSSISDKPNQQSSDLASSRFNPVEPGVKVTLTPANLREQGTSEGTLYSRLQQQTDISAGTANSTLLDPEQGALGSDSQVDNILTAPSGLQGAGTEDTPLAADFPGSPQNIEEEAADESFSGVPTETSITGEVLDEAQLKELESLKQREAEVIRHEQAHAAVGGSVTGAPEYEYTTGPDGNRYILNGEVSVTFSANTPEEKLAEAELVQKAALAPAEPSAQDRAVAREASARAREAEAEIRALEQEEIQEETESDPTAEESVESFDKSADVIDESTERTEATQAMLASDSENTQGGEVSEGLTFSPNLSSNANVVNQVGDTASNGASNPQGFPDPQTNLSFYSSDRGFAGGSAFRVQQNVQEALDQVRVTSAQENGNSNGISASQAPSQRPEIISFQQPQSIDAESIDNTATISLQENAGLNSVDTGSYSVISSAESFTETSNFQSSSDSNENVTNNSVTTIDFSPSVDVRGNLDVRENIGVSLAESSDEEGATPSDEISSRELVDQSPVYARNGAGGVDQSIIQPDPGSLISITA